MKLLGVRYCLVSKEAKVLSDFFEERLGLERRRLWDKRVDVTLQRIFPAGESGIEFVPHTKGATETTGLELVVEDADVMAEHARARGVDILGPIDDNGGNFYTTFAPGGMPIVIRSPRRSVG